MNARMGKTFLFALVGCFALGLAPQPAVAIEGQSYDTRTVKRALRFIGELPTQSQKMSAEVIFVAMNVDVAENRHNLEESRQFFLRVLNALRNGDDEMGIPRSTDPAILEVLEEVEDVWGKFDSTIQRVLISETVTADDVAAVAELNMDLLDAAHETVEAFEEQYLEEHAVRSIMTPITELAERQTLLIMRMSKEFLLLAYGHEVDATEENLIETYTLFDGTLTGLAVGDADMRLIRPPTPEIVSQLRSVQRVWDDVLPILRFTTQYGGITHDRIEEFERLIEPLYEEMEEAADLYEDL